MSRLASVLLPVISFALFVTVLVSSSTGEAVRLNLFIVIAGVLSIVMVVHIRYLLELRSRQTMVLFDLETTAHGAHQAKRQLAANRALAQAAVVEAEALRGTALTLTKNWQLDRVLDGLLESLAELIPYESARVLLIEDDARLLVARERLRRDGIKQTECPLTLDLAGFVFLKRLLQRRSPIVLRDVNEQREWLDLCSPAHPRSLLLIPLVAADRTLGLLCAEHSEVNAFTPEHLRPAQSLAVSIAAAIQNARLYEQAQIYGTELEKRLSDLRQSQKALEQAEEQRLMSEDKFQSVFRSSPVAFSITTLKEGQFLDVNGAFEQRYGVSRVELMNRTIFELNFWEDRADRALLIAQLNNGNSVRNVITRLRTKSGELRLTAYSASRIRFEGKECVLAVSGDIPDVEAKQMN